MIGIMCDINGKRSVFLVDRYAIATSNILKLEKALADDANEYEVLIRGGELEFPSMAFKLPGRELRKEGAINLAALLVRKIGRSKLFKPDKQAIQEVAGEFKGLIKFDPAEKKSILFKERFHTLALYELTVSALLLAIIIKVSI